MWVKDGNFVFNMNKVSCFKMFDKDIFFYLKEDDDEVFYILSNRDVKECEDIFDKINYSINSGKNYITI